MCHKLITVIIIFVLTAFGFGCKKKSAPAPVEPNAPATPPPAAKVTAPKAKVETQADFNEAAKKQITPENMQAELDKIEKEIQQERPGSF